MKIKRRDRIIIVTNGDKTERLYFDYFKRRIEQKKNGQITLDIVPMGQKSEPVRIVERAIQLKQEADSETLHRVWAVIEKDDFQDFSAAIKLGEEAGVSVVYSNKAIEYWFLLHFKFYTRCFTVKELISELDKAANIKYSKNTDVTKLLSAKTKTAISNAKTGHQFHRRNGNNPELACSSTTVYKLINDLFARSR
jgi:hypothetical protein